MDKDLDENEDEDEDDDALSLIHRIDILRKVLRFTQDYTLPRGYSIKDNQYIIKWKMYICMIYFFML